ncbi:DUF2971 domain-containing protein [Pseudomonas fluorescens]|uniref:DUF2971 domain-containing protein n=1 Tax=Pseudomonas fluorescens TaxID=294 RepID=A0A5E7NAL6_PSEFL|nr:DUF2971 domain-containing protein [Pseudomonas fluorescens]VVP34206.1 hypothetical protein PS880_04496 [Pseudomonas fluorescens]
MFKYCPVNTYSLANLENNQLFLNHVSFFNDPFECMCEVLYGFPKLEDRSERLINVLNAWGFSDPDEDPVVELYGEYAESLSEPKIDNLIESARIGCFSSRGTNLLMWTHYADGLKGYCIEFDRDLIIPEERDARVHQVLYADKPSVIDASVMAVLYDQLDYNSDAYFEVSAQAKCYGKDLSGELSIYEDGFEEASDRIREIYQKMLATKPLPWGYEEELRIIDFAQRTSSLGELMPYSLNAIKSVVIGEKMAPENQEFIKAVIQNKNSGIRLKKAVRVAGSFEIHLVDLD